MKKNRVAACLGVTFLAVAGLSLILGQALFGADPGRGRRADSGDPYSLTFDGEHNRPSGIPADGSGSLTVTSDADNDLHFKYEAAADNPDGFLTLTAGGSFSNPFLDEPVHHNAITGITRLNVTFSGGPLSVSFGWGAGYVFENNPIDSGGYYTFQGYNPSYLMILNSGASSVSITSIYIEYTCEPGYDPTAATPGLHFEFDEANECYKVTSYDGGAYDVIIPAFHRENAGEKYLPVTVIGGNAFYGCAYLGSVLIPEGIREIDGNVFWNCTGLTAIHIPASVTAIGDNPFALCSYLATITVDPGNEKFYSTDSEGHGHDCIVTRETGVVIAGCRNTVLPAGVKEIGMAAFVGCSALQAIDLPDDLTTIGRWAFGYCSSLASIFIPAGVTVIGDYAFKDCSSLKIYCQREEGPLPSGWDADWNPDGRPVEWGAHR